MGAVQDGCGAAGEPGAGSFAAALDAAIANAGLTLDRVRHHLTLRGVVVSRATLSYWRQGRSRPERAKSLHAVEHLEEVLALPAGALAGLLGPKAPRGRWLGRSVGTVERRRLWPTGRPIFAELAAPPDGQLQFWSIHDQLAVDNDSQERMLRVRMVAEATLDGVSRALMFYQSDDPGQPAPEVTDVRFCHLGRMRTDPASGLTMFELVLDRPLARGDTTVMEYELRFPPGNVTDSCHRRFTRPVHQYICQVQFASRLPKRVHGYEQRSLTGPRRTGEQLPVGSTRSAILTVADTRPGIHGVRWEW